MFVVYTYPRKQKQHPFTSHVLIRRLPPAEDSLQVVPPQSQQRNPHQEGHRRHEQIEWACRRHDQKSRRSQEKWA